MMDFAKESERLHEQWKGKIEVISRVPVDSEDDLSLAYTPGVAQPCLEIQKDPDKSYELTRRWNTCAVVTDGSAVLGLGDIGPEAGMPVMEGKCVLFKSFGDVDAFPLCVKSHDVDTIVDTVYMISGSFGGINLEDISAPRCFEIERKLKEKCDIPVFHDDQHGTAVITLAGLMNALKVTGKKKEKVKVVTSGAGAAAVSIAKLLLSYGFTNIVMTDRKGIIYKGRREGMNWIKEEMAEITNLGGEKGSLADALKGADVFIGVSAPGLVTEEMVRSMNSDPIIFACANPTPEIFPDQAKAAGAAVVSTGRSDYPNQINNVLAFPGIFRGAFDCMAKTINEEMKLAAAEALAGLIADDELSSDYIIPKAFDHRVGPAVAAAVAAAARRTGAARKTDDKIMRPDESFEFRDIKPEEAEQAAEIEQLVFPPNEANAPEDVKTRIGVAPDLFLVASDRKTGRLAGFLNGIATDEESFRDEFFTDASLHDPNGMNVMLLGLDVLPEYRMKGLATEIMRRYCLREQAKGRKRLVLTCLERLVGMYEKMGFTDRGLSASRWGGESWHEMDIRL